MRTTKINLKLFFIFGLAMGLMLVPMRSAHAADIAVAAGPSEGGVTEEEYVKRMIGHRKFVQIICGEILKMNVFPDADPVHAMDRCNSHDAAKVEQDKNFVEKYSDDKVKIDPKESIAKKMGKNFGNYVNGAQPDRGVIDVTNHVDAKVGADVDQKFLFSKGPLKAEALKIVEEKIKAGEAVEKVADWVARYLWDKVYPGGDGVILRNGEKGTPLFERGGPFDRGSTWVVRPGNPALNGMYHKDDVPALARKLEDDPELMARLRSETSPSGFNVEYEERMKKSIYQENHVATNDGAAGKSVRKTSGTGVDGDKCIEVVIKALDAL